MKYSFYDIIMYLDDVDNYVNSILYYHSVSKEKQKELDLQEILMYLSSTFEIVQDVKDYICSLFYSKN